MAPSRLFAGRQVVVSRTEPDRAALEALVRRHGGAVASRVSRATSLFVQSHRRPDDGRLAGARRAGAAVVPSGFLEACVRGRRLLDPTAYALGERPWPALRVPLASLLGRFRAPEEHWREEEELPQGYDEFREDEERIHVGAEPRRKVLCVLPFASGPDGAGPDAAALALLEDYLGRFFALPLRRLPVRSLTVTATRAKIQGSSQRVAVRAGKLRALDIVAYLYDEVLPRERSALLVLGVVREPVFDGDAAVTVYGRATGDGGCVLSLAQIGGRPGAPGSQTLRNMLGTASHELMHCLGLDHCAFFGCVLNACCDPDAEEDEEGMPPLHLCPVDLRKLQDALAIPDDGVRPRCRRLAEFFAAHGLEAERKFEEQLSQCFV